jgi:hypothetical protein
VRIVRFVRTLAGMTHDETACPLGGRCESCGSAGSGLAVSVLPVLGETLCLTLCPACRSSGTLPSILVSTAAKLVQQHAAHLACVAERRVIRLPVVRTP